MLYDRYEMNAAGLIDTVGSVLPREIHQSISELGPLLDDDPVPETRDVMVSGGASYQRRLLYAMRMAVLWHGDGIVRYITERDYLAQLARLDHRLQGFRRSGSSEFWDEYEVNRLNLREFEEATMFVLGGFGSSADRYRFGEVESIADLLQKRITLTDCTTIVVASVTPQIPDFESMVAWREETAPFYELFELS